ncbi:MAG: nuclear transport factor 2 family protein [Tardiphaga sp.]
MTTAIQDIQDLEERRRAAMIAADVAALDALCADELSYTHSNAAVDGKADYIAKVANGYFDYHALTFSDQQIRLVGDVALVTGRMTGDIVMGGQPRKLNGQTTVIWIKSAGRWQMLAFQSTPVPAS